MQGKTGIDSNIFNMHGAFCKHTEGVTGRWRCGYYVVSAERDSQFCTLSTETLCPTNFDVVGDECLYESTNVVSTSESCLAECRYHIPAEIHSLAQRDALVAYITGPLTVDNGFYIGKHIL